MAGGIGAEGLAQSALSLAHSILDKLVERRILSRQEVDQMISQAAEGQEQMGQRVAKETGSKQSGNTQAARMLTGMKGEADDMESYAAGRKAAWKKGAA